MADYESIISPEELKSNIIDGAFSAHPHKFYVVYDHLMDELIVKLIPPEELTAAYYISNEMALLVESKTYEVVGFQLLNFTTQHLPKLNQLNRIWGKTEVRDAFRTFKEISYEPGISKKARKKKHDSYYFRFKPDLIDEALATC